MGTLGCDIVDLDFMVSMAKAREAMGPGQVLLGNLDPVKALRNSDPQSVTAAVAQCHREAGSRYIVGAGCEGPARHPGRQPAGPARLRAVTAVLNGGNRRTARGPRLVVPADFAVTTPISFGRSAMGSIRDCP